MNFSLPARHLTRLLCCLSIVLGSAAHAAQDDPPLTQNWALYGQFTNLTQWHPAFRAPYSGTNSMDSRSLSAETTDLTLFAGAKLWRGAELWINAEYDQGAGLSNTLGVAGYVSGEAYKVGANTPYLRLPRLFLRQTMDLGGEDEKVEAAANQLTGVRKADNLIFTLGKFSVVDVFDTNSYAHDPRTDFFNWSVVDAGAFDYAADSWGFTLGAAAEWTQAWWTLRGGLFALSTEPNSKKPDRGFRQRSFVAEFEARHTWLGRPGKLKLLGFVNQANMGSYREAVAAAPGTAADVATVRRRQSRGGMALNLEQEWETDLGLFLRASSNDGNKESFDFTEINRSLSLGFALKGDKWGRHDDTLGAAAVVNGLSGAARDYFAAGGMGILIGDGALNYGPEKIFELYYSFKLVKQLSLTLDFQQVVNPAYNRDRGPIQFYGVRSHVEF